MSQLLLSEGADPLALDNQNKYVQLSIQTFYTTLSQVFGVWFSGKLQSESWLHVNIILFTKHEPHLNDRNIYPSIKNFRLQYNTVLTID